MREPRLDGRGERAADGPRVGVDVGGTFTDVALAVAGDLVTAKVPTTDDQSEGVLRGVEKACEAADVPPAAIDGFGHAMTVSTNALLEETGATTALVTTAGFRDVPEIRRQDRPELYDLDAELPAPLVPRRRRFEVDERATVDGVERTVDDDAVRALADRLPAAVESVAVCLLHAYAHPENECRIAELLRDRLDARVSVSHEVLGAFREYERTSTTVVDAYVAPSIDDYLGRLVERAADRELPAPLVMQSNGGVADAATVRERAVTTALSGPAAGVVGAAATADATGLVSFDMGGTSSDVGLVRDGEIERTTDGSVADRPVGVPMVDVTTVGAGGGSVARVDAGGALRVGPQSAGADPGPACYGRGGTEPTVTDANVVLGYIGGGATLGDELELDAAAAERALADLADDAGLDGPRAAARGVYRVVNANMTRAIRSVTVERGYDPRRFALVAFGGAGPMHAAALADSLDVERVVVPRACGVLSAYGLLAADERHDALRTDRRPLVDADPEAVAATLDDLAEEVREGVSAPDAARLSFGADLRYAGQSFELTVGVERPFDPATVRERFHDAHEATYGYRMDDPAELVTLRASAVVERPPIDASYEGRGDARAGSREAYFGEKGRKGVETPVYARERLPVGERIDGPAICEGAESTVVVPPAWAGRVDDDGALALTRAEGGE
jgi:N-methylhydantoinase A